MSCQGDGTIGAITSMWRFENWSRTRSHTVPLRAQPTSVEQLVAVVIAAEMVDGVVRAIGSGWSYPDTAIAAEVTFAIETDALSKVLTGTNATSSATLIPFALNDSARADPRRFVHVEAGIKIHALNLALDKLGLAMITLGGSNGQSLAGAISTGTHGSDADLRPIADVVRAIHLVGPGGQEWWIERSGARAITDRARMVQARDAGRLCPGIRLEYDDLLFNAVLVSVGRMGIVYSYVVEVSNAFKLKQELREQRPWTAVATFIRGSLRDQLAPGMNFIEIVVNPYKNAIGDHDCIITRRHTTTEPLSPETDPDPISFEAFCDLKTVNALLDAVALTLPPLFATATATALAGLSWMLLIPFAGPALYATASTAAIAAATTGLVALEAAILAARSAQGQDLGQKVVAIVNASVALGQKGIVPWLAAALLANQRPSVPASVQQSFRMLTGQRTPQVPQPECLRRVNGLEFALDCSPGSEKLFRLLDDVFMLTDEFLVEKSQPPALGLSLRFTRGTEALIGMQQFSRTCSVEFIMLRGMNGEVDFMRRLYAIAKVHGAIPHWGLIHEIDAAEVATLYGSRLNDWRLALGRLIDEGNGKERTFSTSFSIAHGLEPLRDAKPERSDSSFITALLLNEPEQCDISFLGPLLLCGPD